MTKKLAHSFIRLDVYHTGFYFLVGGNAKQLKAWRDEHLYGYSEMGVPHDQHKSNAGTIWLPKNKETGHQAYVLWVYDMKKKNNLNIGVVVHEVTHLIAAIFRNKGMRLTSASEEAYAYANEYAVRRVLDTMDNKKLWQQ